MRSDDENKNTSEEKGSRRKEKEHLAAILFFASLCFGARDTHVCHVYLEHEHGIDISLLWVEIFFVDGK